MIASPASLIAPSSIAPCLVHTGSDRSAPGSTHLRWPIQFRVGIIVGGSAAVWVAIFALLSAV